MQTQYRGIFLRKKYHGIVQNRDLTIRVWNVKMYICPNRVELAKGSVFQRLVTDPSTEGN